MLLLHKQYINIKIIQGTIKDTQITIMGGGTPDSFFKELLLQSNEVASVDNKRGRVIISNMKYSENLFYNELSSPTGAFRVMSIICGVHSLICFLHSLHLIYEYEKQVKKKERNVFFTRYNI